MSSWFKRNKEGITTSTSEKKETPSKTEESVFENTESSDDDEYDSLFKNL